ncbi:ATP-NAD kinase family protein [Agitococcus lubricus]|uniref:Putative polyphosphate/ATP-dependent NAD kinase n=1 Tax=Agitococcus lubricus TaxID=1077255 RepID=A0A2T5IWX5_9GAMM|nr:ATP-NAD kinase family protein [Agitococcus lubricus]PTQ88434.1 putative polyphosphate/ATP-dependent NAD kinase [Agitococcus lubricus]
MKHENNSCLHSLSIGLIINPIAGLGGAIALKGSDQVLWPDIFTAQHSRAYQRAYQTLKLLQPYVEQLTFFTVSDLMGAALLADLGMKHTVVYETDVTTNAQDTHLAAQAIVAQGIDLLLFAGGDGTARDLCQLNLTVPVLGIPSGVKMHSGVFAINPESAASLIEKLISGGGVVIESAEVRDLDEQLLQQAKVQTRFYGELNVPVDIRLVQQVKCATIESDELAQMDIAAYVIELLEPDVVYLLGVGSTCAAIMANLGYVHTLLGFDALLNQQLIGQDLTETDIGDLMARYPCKVILTATGGQGIILGRGNQQLSPTILRQMGRENLMIVLTPHKLQGLMGRALRLDTGDMHLNAAWRGLITVITGYQQQQLYYLE